MNSPTIRIVVALAKKNRVIGKNNKLAWYIAVSIEAPISRIQVHLSYVFQIIYKQFLPS